MLQIGDDERLESEEEDEMPAAEESCGKGRL